MDRAQAKNCEQNSSCRCEYIMVTCLIGPDSMGNFQREQVPLSYAESCERDKCVCSSHDNFVEMAEKRVAEAQTLEERIQKLVEDFQNEIEGLME